MTDDLVIFLHLPKTAGTSFLKSLTDQLRPREILKLYGTNKTSPLIADEIGALPSDRRKAIRVLAGHQIWYGIHELFPERRPRYVTFLRDPVSRVVSNYWKIMRDSRHHLHDTFVNTHPTLSDFIAGKLTPVVFNHMTVFLGRSATEAGHNQAQCCLFDEELLNQAIQNLRKFWFVGLRESYATDLQRLSTLLSTELQPFHFNAPPAANPERAAVSRAEIERCCDNNRMDSLLYHLAVLIHETQEPDNVPWS